MNPLRAWNVFWFRPVSARPLGAFRIVVGVLTLVHLGLLWFDLDHWLTDAGLLIGDEARAAAGPLRFSPLIWLQDPFSVRLFVAGAAVAAALFTIGWRTRIMGVVLFLGILSIHHRNIATNCGPDNVLLIWLFYLMLAPSGAACSLDARRLTRQRGTIAEPIIQPWALRLIQLHLCLIYLNTAVLKCNGATWLGGTALHFVLNNPEVGRFNLTVLCQYPVLLNVMTLGALFIEFALGFLLWFRPTRVALALLGLALHGGILLTVNVPLFGELMTAAYLTFLDPDELDRLLALVNPRAWLRRRGETARAPVVVPGRVDAPEGFRGPRAGVAISADKADAS